jgi:hypothetical protein
LWDMMGLVRMDIETYTKRRVKWRRHVEHIRMGEAQVNRETSGNRKGWFSK